MRYHKKSKTRRSYVKRRRTQRRRSRLSGGSASRSATGCNKASRDQCAVLANEGVCMWTRNGCRISTPIRTAQRDSPSPIRTTQRDSPSPIRTAQRDYVPPRVATSSRSYSKASRDKAMADIERMLGSSSRGRKSKQQRQSLSLHSLDGIERSGNRNSKQRTATRSRQQRTATRSRQSPSLSLHSRDGIERSVRSRTGGKSTKKAALKKLLLELLED